MRAAISGPGRSITGGSSWTPNTSPVPATRTHTVSSTVLAVYSRSAAWLMSGVGNLVDLCGVLLVGFDVEDSTAAQLVAGVAVPGGVRGQAVVAVEQQITDGGFDLVHDRSVGLDGGEDFGAAFARRF